MVPPELSARFGYLNDSAHLLATTAPATSRYLMSRCNTLMFESNIEQSVAHRRKTCGACGTIMIAGWEGTVRMESQRPRLRGRIQKRITQNPSKVMVYECESCSRITRFSIPLPTPRNKIGLPRPIHSLGAGVPSPSPAKDNPNANSTTSANSSSKKRAKARKQSSLEAILARKKASEAGTSGFGLNLMDFMKRA
jgi:RNase P subunit RPR2